MSSQNPYPWLEIKDLPRLPIPNLKETLDFYIELVEPLVPPEQFNRTAQLALQFLEKDGPELDRDLHQLREEASTSWLEGLWDTGYLEYRGENPVNVNPCFAFSDTPDMSQVRGP